MALVTFFVAVVAFAGSILLGFMARSAEEAYKSPLIFLSVWWGAMAGVGLFLTFAGHWRWRITHYTSPIVWLWFRWTKCPHGDHTGLCGDKYDPEKNEYYRCTVCGFEQHWKQIGPAPKYDGQTCSAVRITGLFYGNEPRR